MSEPAAEDGLEPNSITAEEAAADDAKLQAMRSRRAGRRRGSVSAECGALAPSSKPYAKPFYPKSADDAAAIESCVRSNFLFSSLGVESRKAVIEAMFCKEVGAGENVIVQGEGGDYFYVVKNGGLEVLIDGTEGPVLSYTTGSAFGELALMYNCPRAATVKATEASALWALDRETFRHMLTNDQNEKRRKYEQFLRTCPAFENADLEGADIARLADVLEEMAFEDGEDIIKQGEDDFERMKFYIVFKGNAAAFQKIKDNEEVKVKDYVEGEFFGELALLEKNPRAATVRAVGSLTVAALDVAAFERLLGPLKEHLGGSERASQYEQASAAAAVAAGSGVDAARMLAAGET